MSSPDQPIDIHELPGVLFRTSSIKKNPKKPELLALTTTLCIIPQNPIAFNTFVGVVWNTIHGYYESRQHFLYLPLRAIQSVDYRKLLLFVRMMMRRQKQVHQKKKLHRCKYNLIHMKNTEKNSVCQCCCPIFCFTHTSTGTLSSRGSTAPSSFKSIRWDSRRSMIVKAVRNKADRPESKRARLEKW